MQKSSFFLLEMAMAPTISIFCSSNSRLVCLRITAAKKSMKKLAQRRQ
ncbi:hypothetical protein JWG39_07190 [Desulforhopalus vacuolatus]|nr:hypothetical protein [Desulforhopalus vacuolatus]MBM9519604.1 hypothetical protein [Desulforhopalus vacuolatus]